MHVKLVRQILVLWISLWLPFAGAVAGAMPLIGPTGPAAMVALDAAMAHSPAATADSRETLPCHTDADKSACDHCELCHIATSLMPATAVPVAGAEAGRENACTGRATFESHFPEQPQRPPLSPQA